MYDIVRIDLEDFGVFRGKHSFEFPAEPGLYGVTGKNLDITHAVVDDRIVFNDGPVTD